MRKLFTRESSQQTKEETRNLFGFSFTTTKLQLIKLERKTEKKREIFLGFLKFFKHIRTRQENKTSMDDTMKKYEHRQLK